MAHKKGKGATRNKKDSIGRRLGIKRYGGELINAGTIIVRQRGTVYFPGENVLRGRDDTLFAKITGRVLFSRKNRSKKIISIIPA